MTPEELALLRLVPGDPLPCGGQILDVEVKSGNQTSVMWSHVIYGPIFAERYGVAFWPGTLNLWAASPVTWENPMQIRAHEFCPIILAESAIGVVLRWIDVAHQTPAFLEVLSPIELRPRLGNLQNGQEISVRLLSGDLMQRG